MSNCLRALAGLVLIAGAAFAEAAPEPDDGLDVFFRNSDLTALAEQGWAEYSPLDPGESLLLDRAFPGAPPQIPHSMEDLLPILADDNVCLECHSPEEAEDMDATAIPESHYRRPRVVGVTGAPGAEDATAEGPMQVRVAGFEAPGDLTGFQFNCMQCHVPQAENVEDITSTFEGGGPAR